jgi:hypothetical protein
MDVKKVDAMDELRSRVNGLIEQKHATLDASGLLFGDR